MRWHLLLEEFRPELKYIKGEKNAVADALSRLEMSDNKEILKISELYGYNDTDLPDIAYPRYHDISKAQKTDAKLNQKLVSHKDCTLDTFSGGDQNHSLISQNSKVCLPVALQKKTVDWYHEIFFHPGETRTEHTLHKFLTGKDFAQQSTTCVRNAQHDKKKRQTIRNMANFHLNILKQIPWTRYVYTSLTHVRSL